MAWRERWNEFISNGAKILQFERKFNKEEVIHSATVFVQLQRETKTHLHENNSSVCYDSDIFAN